MYYILFPPFPNLRGWGNVRYSSKVLNGANWNARKECDVTSRFGMIVTPLGGDSSSPGSSTKPPRLVFFA